jgi:hypothetical protein
MTETAAWVQDVLDQQLAMNEQTWAALQEHGANATSTSTA